MCLILSKDDEFLLMLSPSDMNTGLRIEMLRMAFTHLSSFLASFDGLVLYLPVAVELALLK